MEFFKKLLGNDWRGIKKKSPEKHGMKNKSNETIWDVSEDKESWMKNFKDLYRNYNDVSRIKMNATKANVQEKKMKSN